MMQRNIGLLLLAASPVSAAELPTVAQPTDWSSVVIVVVVLALIVAAVLLHRRFPAQAAKADLAVKTEAVKVLGEIRDHFKSAPATPAAGPTGAPASPDAPPPAPAGKNGVAGVLTLPVTGDPKADLAAFQAAYFS